MIERIYELERRIMELERRLAAVAAQANQTIQAVNSAWSTWQPPISGAAGGIYYIQAAGAPVITAGGSNSAPIYQLVSGVATSVGTFTVYNVMGVATVTSKPIIVAPNGDGTYMAVSQSC